MKIFKVYDDEWEAIYGRRQLKQFACEQVRNAPDDFLEENDAFYGLSKKDTEQFKYWIEHCLKSPCHYVENIKFCRWVIEDIRHYEIEEIEVY